MLRIRGSQKLTLQTGTIISGFKLTHQTPIPELNVIGLSFIHERTKMRYYHYVSSDDTNNVFCIGFNTPNPNSQGIPHILEHTTLCGSQKYPVRDPFFYMLKRSLNTFMNAMTGPSYTIYPFSTVNEKDFSNLLSVYLDAVFKPLLRKRDFLQEGHRFEFEESKGEEAQDGDLTIKGIVYNEMKGALENPASFFYSKLCEHALMGTSYEHVLGGCPSAIPDLDHADLLAYHENHYHPTNAVVVTYGDMDFTAHLSTLNSALEKMELKIRHGIPLLSAEYTKQVKGNIVDYGPLDVMGEAEKSTRVVVSWIVPSTYFENTLSESEICFNYITFEVLSALLTSGPASPMYKALIESHMGTDFTPSNGFESDFRNPLFSFGLQGVDISQHSQEEISKAIAEALKKAHTNGFHHDLVDGIIHQLQLSKRHRSSSFGLHLSYSSVLSDLQSGFVFPFLETSAALEKIRTSHKENPKYFSTLIEKIFITTPPRVTLTLHADKLHAEKRKALEAKRIEEKRKVLQEDEKQNIKAMAKELIDAQNQVQDLSTLPTLLRADIDEQITPDVRGEIVNYGKNTSEIIVASCNQLVYTNVLIPLDLTLFTAEESLLLPTYASLLGSVGAGDLDYEVLSTKMERLCSGYDMSIHITPYPCMTSVLCGLHVNFHALPNRYEEAMDLLKKIFLQVSFQADDVKVVSRVISLLSSNATSMIQSVPHNGHRYAMSAAASRISPVCKLSSSMEGLEQIVYMRNILNKLTSTETDVATNCAKEIITTLQKIHTIVRMKHAMELWSVCETSDQKLVHEQTLQFMNEVGTEEASIGRNALQYCPQDTTTQKSSFVSITTPGEVGYLAVAVPCHTKYGEKDAAVQQVALKVLSNEFLHREIREKGGAYGSGASTRPAGNLSFAFAMFSYRDPTPLKSFQTMCNGLHKYLQDDTMFEDRAVDEALLSMFGAMDAPRTPSSYGSYWYLSRMGDNLRQQNRRHLLSTQKADIVACAKNLAKYIEEYKVCVCLGNTQTVPGSAEEELAKKLDLKWDAQEF